jgi:hypothetical protein
MDTQKDLLAEYASLKKQVSLLEDRLDEIKPAVEEAVIALNPTDMIVETDFGTFTMVGKRKYEYTQDVVEREESLKQVKKEEEATGRATYTETKYLKFSSSNIE